MATNMLLITHSCIFAKISLNFDWHIPIAAMLAIPSRPLPMPVVVVFVYLHLVLNE
jgi:hypothetical protein